MGRVRGLYDPPGLHQEQKTTVKNGIIIRNMIWKDHMGNEFEKVGNKFVLKRNHGTSPYTPAHPLSAFFSILPIEWDFGVSSTPSPKPTKSPAVRPPTPVLRPALPDSDEFEITSEFLFLACFFLFFLLSFALGYLCATAYHISRKSLTISLQPSPQLLQAIHNQMNK